MITSGMKLKDALRLAARLGCEVAKVNKTGEVRVRWPPSVPRPDGVPWCVTSNERKKDASRVLTTFLKRLEEVSRV